jgi:hypothetical protein
MVRYRSKSGSGIGHIYYLAKLKNKWYKILHVILEAAESWPLFDFLLFLLLYLTLCWIQI